MKKPVIYTEIIYPIALILLAFGTALTAYGDFGISMVLAPAYILHLCLSRFWPFFSFGVAEYVLQATVLLVLILVMRKAKLSYLLSFAATVLYGIVLDGAMWLTTWLPGDLYVRIVLYVIGCVICCGSLALLFGCYLPPAAYELFSKEVSAKVGKPVHVIVNYYNLASLATAVILSFLFFGELRGVGIGTVACAFFYGIAIHLFQLLYGKIFRLTDRFNLRGRFEESKKN